MDAVFMCRWRLESTHPIQTTHILFNTIHTTSPNIPIVCISLFPHSLQPPIPPFHPPNALPTPTTPIKNPPPNHPTTTTLLPPLLTAYQLTPPSTACQTASTPTPSTTLAVGISSKGVRARRPVREDSAERAATRWWMAVGTR